MSILELQAALAALLPRLRRFGRSLTHHREDADDLVQAAVERALRSLDQFEPGTRLDSWMFRIMKNAWIDEQRARGRRSEVLTDDDVEIAAERAGPSDGPHFDQQVARLSLDAALARLPDEQRLVVGLVMIEGLPYKEAAEVLDLPIGTVTSRLARARDTLQRLLGDADLGS